MVTVELQGLNYKGCKVKGWNAMVKLKLQGLNTKGSMPNAKGLFLEQIKLHTSWFTKANATDLAKSGGWADIP